MNKRVAWVCLVAMAGLGVMTAGASAQQRPGAAAVRSVDVPALNIIQKGKWAVRDSEGAERTMCVRDPYQILRPENVTTPCQNMVLESAASRATVRSTCTGHGTMLTRITTDTPRQVTVEMQGVIDGQPFSETYDARRIGDCS
ncbi:DUF3617 family protein [uncultured Sphingomonas sp.]|uniref:DUF3617 family protein n=1 Tax=uncultured Sphingomonas sp. TaxID=158754 RepID=UPI0025FB5B77|nr:DUF3617 family protein [uncultured Sphingomonas sp.]